MLPLTNTHGFAPPRLERLFEVVTDGVLALDIQGRPSYINTSAERILGRARHELLGRPLWVELPELEETELSQAFHRAFAEGVPVTVEQYLAPLGAWLEARLFPADEGLLVFLRDVTPLRMEAFLSEEKDLESAHRREERLTEELSRLELISEANAALSSTLDLRQAMERLTRSLVPRFAEWCGVYLREGEGPVERVAFTDVDPVRALRLRKEGRLLEGPHELLEVLERGREALTSEPDETRRELLRTFMGLRGISVPIAVDGRSLGVLVLAAGDGYRAYDAHDLQAAEKLARQAAITVEHARLFEMARQERDRAEEANRAKDDFLATVSHELRTPLTAILGWASILSSNVLPPEKHEHALETVKRSARSLAQLVDDLLDISRIVAGRMRLEMQPVELATVVEAALEGVRPTAAARNILLEPWLEPGVGLVQGDAHRLQQVAWNLLTNAIKFTPEGGQVKVRLCHGETHVVLEVTDSGQGIAPAFLPHVFERFRQEDGGVTRRYGGLGLGLAIVRHLVELHGGTVQAHSKGEGHGACFIVKLPLAGTRAPPARPEMPQPEHLPDLSKVRVLVVDDEQDTRELLQVLLEDRGAQVTTASSASEALALLMRAPPDLLVSDIGMPDEDGYSLIRQVRALPPDKGGQVPAAALTAYTRLKERTRALGAGFQVYVPKPIDPAELVMALANLINRFSRR